MTEATKARAPWVAMIAIIAVPVLFHVMIVETNRLPLNFSMGGMFKLSFIGVSVLSHWSLYASLLATFGLTLRRDHTPLITVMARRLHGTLSNEMVGYTRRVTVAWTVFFAAQLLISVSLFCFAPVTVWSIFVNLLDIPLVIAMFAAEYAVRLCVLRHPPRHSLAMIFEMIRDCMRQPPVGSSPPSGLPPQ